MKAGRKADPDKRETVGLRLRGSIRKQIEAMADDENRTFANMAEQLLICGLAAKSTAVK